MIEFPALDYTDNWNSDVEPVFYDGYFYSTSDELFEQYAEAHIIVDSKGALYKIVGKENLGWWRKWSPFHASSKLIFENCEKSISLEHLKEYVLNKIDNLDSEVPDAEWSEHKKTWMENVKNATTFKAVILGS